MSHNSRSPFLPSAIRHLPSLLRRTARLARNLVLAFATPLMEKDLLKAGPLRSRALPFVFSMSRLVVLAFATAMIHQAWRVGIIGWPDATLSMTIVLALPILGAIERAKPDEAIALASAIAGRFGIGAARSTMTALPEDPSPYDDHRDDETTAPSTRRNTASRRSAS